MQSVLLSDADRVDDPGSHHDSVCHLTAPDAWTATNTVLASYSSSCAVMLNIPGSFSPRSVATPLLTNTRFFSCTSPPTLKIEVGGLMSYADEYKADLDNLKDPGLYLVTNGIPGLTSNYVYMQVFRASASSTIVQIGYSITEDKILQRSFKNGSWTSFKTK